MENKLTPPANIRRQSKIILIGVMLSISVLMVALLAFQQIRNLEQENGEDVQRPEVTNSTAGTQSLSLSSESSQTESSSTTSTSSEVSSSQTTSKTSTSKATSSQPSSSQEPLVFTAKEFKNIFKLSAYSVTLPVGWTVKTNKDSSTPGIHDYLVEFTKNGYVLRIHQYINAFADHTCLIDENTPSNRYDPKYTILIKEYEPIVPAQFGYKFVQTTKDNVYSVDYDKDTGTVNGFIAKNEGDANDIQICQESYDPQMWKWETNFGYIDIDVPNDSRETPEMTAEALSILSGLNSFATYN